MRNSVQLNLPPAEVARVGTREGVANSVGNGNSHGTRAANSVGNAAAERVGSLDLVTVALAAAERVGYYDKELAAIFQLSASDFSKAFNVDDPSRNRPMKTKLPKEFAEAFVRVMAEMLGLRVGGTEAQSRAFANLMQACTDVIRAGQP